MVEYVSPSVHLPAMLVSDRSKLLQPTLLPVIECHACKKEIENTQHQAPWEHANIKGSNALATFTNTDTN